MWLGCGGGGALCCRLVLVLALVVLMLVSGCVVVLACGWFGFVGGGIGSVKKLAKPNKRQNKKQRKKNLAPGKTYLPILGDRDI